MNWRGRPKSTNIEDRRTPPKMRSVSSETKSVDKILSTFFGNRLPHSNPSRTKSRKYIDKRG